MFKTTLDTNIIVSAFTEETACKNLVDTFLSEENLSNGNYFLTPAVLDELTGLFTRFMQLFHEIKTIMKNKKKSFIESYKELENTIDGGPNKSLANAFGNLIDFVQKSENYGLAITTIEDSLKQRVARFYRPDIKLLPSQDTVKEKHNEVNSIKEEIESKKINKGKDAVILAQLILLNKLSLNDIHLYTKNKSDFDDSSEAWKELCPFISVLSP